MLNKKTKNKAKQNKPNIETNGLVILSMSFLFLRLFICQSPRGFGQITFYLQTCALLIWLVVTSARNCI